MALLLSIYALKKMHNNNVRLFIGICIKNEMVDILDRDEGKVLQQ